jgi:cytochrome bd-type quinol oxidase subunit 2
MRLIRGIFATGYSAIVFLFACCGIFLIGLAALELWRGIFANEDTSYKDRFDIILESIGYLTIAVAALELGQTVLEEEVLRTTHVSGPTRARRFLSRFLIVVVVALSVESLIAVFQFGHQNPELLPQAASVALAAAVLLAAWGVFVKLNRSAEELEPEAMAETKREDKEIVAKEQP